MRIRMLVVIVFLLVLWTTGAVHGQISDPVPALVEKRGLMVEVTDLVRLPDTRGLRPADQDVSPAGRASISSATFRMAAVSPTTHAACCI